MKISHRAKKIIPLLGLMSLLVLQFQNCAKKEFVFEDELVAETMNYFEYRYTKPTPIYFEIQVLPTEVDATYQSYDVLGFATASDGSDEAIDWKIEVFDTNNQSICALKTGQLTAGETLINESCVINKTIKLGSAVIQVKRQSSNEWQIYTKKYN